MGSPRLQVPRLTTGQWITAAVILFIVVAVFSDVITSLEQVRSGQGPPQAQLNGSLPSGRLRVGVQATFDFALDDTAGGAIDPACVGGNLAGEFRIVGVTFLGTPGSSWRDGRSCGQILETGSVVPVVITVIPLHPGTYTISVVPQEGPRRVGSGTRGTVRVGP